MSLYHIRCSIVCGTQTSLIGMAYVLASNNVVWCTEAVLLLHSIVHTILALQGSRTADICTHTGVPLPPGEGVVLRADE